MITASTIKKPYKHERGIHCITTAMSNLLSHYGISLSEELCLGIGSGLGFTYTRGRKLEQFLVFGRNDDLELNLCEILGIHPRLSQHPNSQMALERIIKKTEMNELVIVDLDISKLPYLANTLKWPETSSHGGHKAVFGGYDSLTDEVLLYEYLWIEPMRLKRANFFHAWNTYNGLAPACNLWYEFEYPTSIVPIDQAIKDGIEMNVFRLLSPWNKFHGMDGLRAFLKEAPDWKYLLREEDRMKLAYASYISLEIGGTGKGAFRTMYSRFLKIAAIELENYDLFKLSKEYLSLSRLWSEFALLLEEGSQDYDRGIFSGSLSNEKLAQNIYKKEHEAILQLQAISIDMKRENIRL